VHSAPEPHWHPSAPHAFALDMSQAVQAAPFVPQVASDDVSHVAPAQQPVPQFCGVQPVQTCEVHVCGEGHAEQAEPCVPQAVVVVPGKHAFPLQHPVGHDVALQTHAPPEQICPAEHAAVPPQVQAPAELHPSAVTPHVVHVAPWSPQVVADGASQTFPEQQPLGHDVALQTHAPLVHTWPVPHAGPDPHLQAPAAQLSDCGSPHAAHAAPAVPHVAVDEVSQVVPLQHPVGHEVALQTQAPAEHSWPTAHSETFPHMQSPMAEQPSALVASHATHDSPPNPQDAGDRALHVGPEQHPVAHVDAHPLHVPLLHVSPPGHDWHCVPPLPHAPTLLPVWHVPLEQHPSGHETPSHWHVPFKQRCPAAHAPPVPHLQLPSPHESADPVAHTAHAWPTAAQAVRESAVQVVPSQHPFGHDVASQTHTWFAQCSPGLHGVPDPHWQTPMPEQESAATGSHVTHVDPTSPQLESACETHVASLQHPSGHDVGSHWHVPFKQRCPSAHAAWPPHVQVPDSEQASDVIALQVTHVVPLAPQADRVVAVVQVFPTQHPAH
jgi:hypothetical protein